MTYKTYKPMTEGWMNHKGGNFSADISDIEAHAHGTGKNIHCPGCKKVLGMSDFKASKDDDNDVTAWNHTCKECGAKLVIFNEGITKMKPTFKQFLLAEAKKDGPSKSDMVTPHDYSVKLLWQGKTGRFPALKGEIYEKDVLIGTFSRGATRDGFGPPIESKFRTEKAKMRFDDFADSNSIGETIEALLPALKKVSEGRNDHSPAMQKAIAAMVRDDDDEEPMDDDQIRAHGKKHKLTPAEIEELVEIGQGPIGY